MRQGFQDLRVLIAEDDFLVAPELAQVFRSANAHVVGPCASLEEATRCASASQMAFLTST